MWWLSICYPSWPHRSCTPEFDLNFHVHAYGLVPCSKMTRKGSTNMQPWPREGKRREANRPEKISQRRIQPHAYMHICIYACSICSHDRLLITLTFEWWRLVLFAQSDLNPNKPSKNDVNCQFHTHRLDPPQPLEEKVFHVPNRSSLSPLPVFLCVNKIE